MLHYTDRKDKVFILTLDDVLAQDVYERLANEKRMKGVELIVPGSGKGRIHVEDIDKLARETLTARLLIMDMRSQTQVSLQAAYNKVICYNRADLNQYCFTILIGDGPVRLFQNGCSPDVFGPLLARMRVDCNAALFFYDPLLHYEYDEKRQLGIGRENSILEMIPKRLEGGFTGDEKVTVRQIRPYFRAASAKGSKKQGKKNRRQKKLARLLAKKMIKHLGGNGFSDCLTKEGYAIEGEALSLNVYPFAFEEWAGDLLARARASVGL